MTTPIAVALADLGEVVLAAFVAGVGVTAAFSLALKGALRGGAGWRAVSVVMGLVVLVAVAWGLKIVAS